MFEPISMSKPQAVAIVPAQAAQIQEAPKAVWTKIYDMHSGGGAQMDEELFFIEAPQEEAAIIFWHRYEMDVHRTSCTCCGPDYAIYEVDPQDVHEVSAWGAKAVIIRAQDIKDHERIAPEDGVPRQGYVWMGG